VKLNVMFAAALAVVTALALVSTANALPPTLTSVTQSNGQISATWSFDNTQYGSWDIEVGRSWEVDPTDGYFPDANTAAYYGGLLPGDTTYTFGPLPPGTYYVHVQTATTICFTNPLDLACAFEFSAPPVAVNIPAPPPPPPPLPPSRPPPLLAPLSSADPVVAPGDVIVARSQDVDKLSITISPGENVKATLSGSVRVPGASKVFRFKSVTQSVAAGLKTTKLALRLSGKSKKAVKKALKRKKVLKAKLTLLLTDAAGNKKTLKYTVRLKP
jgi:hypothetical protein